MLPEKNIRYTNLVRKKRLSIKDKGLKNFLKKGGRKGAKKDFLELLKRAATPPIINS